ncbi:uncharacterized protein LOC142224768 [Haematobia irritans]|uniref:uncharacterized protein LOC142224768 n=1 Tax=Haematobia irritans TaxID=7368 RepID=UPI003F507F89
MQDSRMVSTPAEKVNELSRPSKEMSFPYREAVGSLMYLAIVSRPDIAFAVSHSSRFLDCFNNENINAVKRIFKYLRGTEEQGIEYIKTKIQLDCYTDSDYAGDIESRHSTSGYVIMLSGGPISWSSKRQSTITLSTTEAEYVTASEGVKELMWVKRLFHELYPECQEVSTLNMDNQSAKGRITTSSDEKNAVMMRSSFLAAILMKR